MQTRNLPEGKIGVDAERETLAYKSRLRGDDIEVTHLKSEKSFLR